MPNLTLATADQIAAWRSGTAPDSPAGPLFSSRYSQSEIVEFHGRDTRVSLCSGSHTVQCC